MTIFIILAITGLHLFLWGRFRRVNVINQNIIARNQVEIFKNQKQILQAVISGKQPELSEFNKLVSAKAEDLPTLKIDPNLITY